MQGFEGKVNDAYHKLSQPSVPQKPLEHRFRESSNKLLAGSPLTCRSESKKPKGIRRKKGWRKRRPSSKTALWQQVQRAHQSPVRLKWKPIKRKKHCFCKFFKRNSIKAPFFWHSAQNFGTRFARSDVSVCFFSLNFSLLRIIYQ